MHGRIRRTLILTVLALVVVLLVGATYQGVATAIERRRFPAPGHMVDVGGHQLHIHCTGEGWPTVVLEAPAMGTSATWGWVQRELSAVTRVCSYDRAGLGWSEAGDGPYDPAATPPELRTLLLNAHEPAPYLLVGHSLGGAFALLYAARYPAEVAGLVLLEAPHPDQRSRLPGDEAQAFDRFLSLIGISPWLARTGILRLTGTWSGNVSGLPAPDRGAATAFFNRPDHLTRAAREYRQFDAIMAQLREAQPALAGRPVLVVAAGEAEERQSQTALRLSQELQRERLALSEDSDYLVIDGASHLTIVTEEEPARRVSAAVAGLVTRIRARSSVSSQEP